MKYLKFILFFIFLLINNNLFASNINTFKKANDYFNNGEYELSRQLYESLLDSGYHESEIYYNLANSYFRLNNIPAAILNYERAKRLKPNDDDIDFNLKLANLKIVDKFEPVPKLFIFIWLDYIMNFLYSGVWANIIIISIWVFLASLFVLIINFAPKFRLWFLFLLFSSLIIAGISSVFAYKAYQNEQSKNKAIIFTPSVYVKSAPDPGSTDLFILHEGTKIHIMDAIDDWIQIKVENGDIGWINNKDIEVI